MERFHVVFAAGIVVGALLALINIYIGGIAFILFATLAMSLWIMQDSRSLADVGVRLSEDAKRISVTNIGNTRVHTIRVSLVPLNKEFELGMLEKDESREFRLDEMISEARAVVVFTIPSGDTIRKTFTLSSLGKGDDDVLKPMFPLFRQE